MQGRPGSRLLLPLFSSLLLLAGCDRVGLILHRNIRIAKVPVKNAELDLHGKPGIAPGQKKQLIATFQDEQGKTWITQGAGKGKILWSDLQMTVTLVAYKKGTITLPNDPRTTEGGTVHVAMTVPTHPGVQAALDIPLRYDYPFRAVYSGSSGSSGSNGSNGTDGSSGTMGSTDPDNPSPGGNGGDGSDGGNGTDGGDGSDGPDVTVRIAMHPVNAGAKPMLEAVATVGGHHDHYYLIDPDGGSLTIQSNGGSGGKGGSAGRGGSGGSGGSGSPPGMNGLSGHDGSAGRDGSDGAAGRISITYDPAVKAYLTAVHAGERGGPAPVFQEAPVAALW